MQYYLSIYLMVGLNLASFVRTLAPITTTNFNPGKCRIIGIKADERELRCDDLVLFLVQVIKCNELVIYCKNEHFELVCGEVKIKHHTDTCLIEIETHTQIAITIPHSVGNTIGIIR